MSHLPLFSCGLESAKLVVSSDLLHHSWAAILDLERDTTNPNEQSLPFSVKFKDYPKPPNYTIIAFVTSTTCTKQHLQEEGDLASSAEISPLFEFLCTENSPSFSIHRRAITLFASLLGELSFLRNQLEQLGSSRSLIITGHSLGGSIASLFTLWLLENLNPSTTKRPLCITFGSPFTGDNGLQQAISQRPTWNSCFLHVASNHDPIPKVFISPQNPTKTTLYKRFGTFLLCSELGYACFEDPKLIVELLVETGLDSAGSQDPNEASQMIDYGTILEHLKRRALVKGISEWFTDPHLTGIVTQLKAIGVIRTQQQQHNIDINTLIGSIQRRERASREKKRNTIDPSKKLSGIKINMAQLEWYKKSSKAQGIGHYDSYKNKFSAKDINVNLPKKKLTIYWKGQVKEVEGNPQKEGAAFQTHWLRAGTAYRRMVEPLDIAEYYRQPGSKDYCKQRSIHYILLELWQMDEALQADRQNATQRNMACSLTLDSCFWAYVEEAIISLKLLKSGESSLKERESSWESLKEFEEYIMDLINNYAVDPEIFLEQSSFMKWWREYENIIEASDNSPFITYMKNKSYRQYA